MFHRINEVLETVTKPSHSYGYTCPDGSQVQGASLGLLGAAGWPIPPGLQPACGACIGGFASTAVNASYCSLCGPGTFAASLRSPQCSACPAGTYTSSWGTSHCRHCVLGACRMVLRSAFAAPPRITLIPHAPLPYQPYMCSCRCGPPLQDSAEDICNLGIGYSLCHTSG